MASTTERIARKMPDLLCVGIMLSSAAILRGHVKAAAALAIHDDRYIEVAVAPILCILLIWWERARIFSKARFSPRVGVPLLLPAILLCVGVAAGGNEGARLPLTIFAAVLVWIATFVLCYGAESFRRAVIPFCCLLLMVPAPASWMDRATVTLQHASAATSFAILRATGIPVFRDGMVFVLRDLSVEVAKECSGIRSCLVFLLVAIVASRVCLRFGWAQLMFVAAMVPIAIFKNAVRIVVISLLSAYVDPGYLHSWLHRDGGVVFSLVGVGLFAPLLVALQWVENRGSEANSVTCTAPFDNAQPRATQG